MFSEKWGYSTGKQLQTSIYIKIAAESMSKDLSLDEYANTLFVRNQ